MPFLCPFTLSVGLIIYKDININNLSICFQCKFRVNFTEKQAVFGVQTMKKALKTMIFRAVSLSGEYRSLHNNI